jgi:hypothetical protein
MNEPTVKFASYHKVKNNAPKRRAVRGSRKSGVRIPLDLREKQDIQFKSKLAEVVPNTEYANGLFNRYSNIPDYLDLNMSLLSATAYYLSEGKINDIEDLNELNFSDTVVKTYFGKIGIDLNDVDINTFIRYKADFLRYCILCINYDSGINTEIR